MPRKKSFYRMGYEAFRVRDINKDVYELVENTLGRAHLDDKMSWCKGWVVALNKYYNKKKKKIS